MTDRTKDAARGVLRDPLRNRGTAFDYDQRRRLGLTGRLPSAVETLDGQATRCWEQLNRRSTPMDKFIYLDLLHDRNEVLYFKVLADHLAELLPVVYTPPSGRRSRTGAGTTASRRPPTSRSTAWPTSSPPWNLLVSGPRTSI